MRRPRNVITFLPTYSYKCYPRNSPHGRQSTATCTYICTYAHAHYMSIQIGLLLKRCTCVCADLYWCHPQNLANLKLLLHQTSLKIKSRCGEISRKYGILMSQCRIWCIPLQLWLELYTLYGMDHDQYCNGVGTLALYSGSMGRGKESLQVSIACACTLSNPYDYTKDA